MLLILIYDELLGYEVFREKCSVHRMINNFKFKKLISLHSLIKLVSIESKDIN